MTHDIDGAAASGSETPLQKASEYSPSRRYWPSTDQARGSNLIRDHLVNVHARGASKLVVKYL